MIQQDSIRWRPLARVAKFSPDQVAYAARRARIPHEHVGAGEVGLYLGEPEEYTEAAGNLLVTAGLDAITKLLLNTGSPQALAVATATAANTRTWAGVGATSTGPAIGNTTLTADGGSAYYLNVDNTYPTQANGLITIFCTFTSGVANFAWNEWGVGTCTGTITAGATLASIATGTKMWNHAAGASLLGTKVSGAVWQLQATITLS